MSEHCNKQATSGVVIGRYCGRSKHHNGLCWFTNERPEKDVTDRLRDLEPSDAGEEAMAKQLNYYYSRAPHHDLGVFVSRQLRAAGWKHPKHDPEGIRNAKRAERPDPTTASGWRVRAGVAMSHLNLEDQQAVIREFTPDDKQCPDCEGSGRVLLGVHVVSRDMAKDIGEPDMQGQEIPKWGQCNLCHGASVTFPDASPDIENYEELVAQGERAVHKALADHDKKDKPPEPTDEMVEAWLHVWDEIKDVQPCPDPWDDWYKWAANMTISAVLAVQQKGKG